MPRLDGTGPWGEGPMTGGARGYCNPGYAGYGPAYARGYGLGWGRGYGYERAFGWRWAHPARWGWYGQAYGPVYAGPFTMSREDEISMLKEQPDMIKADLDSINKRIEELESESPHS